MVLKPVKHKGLVKIILMFVISNHNPYTYTMRDVFCKACTSMPDVHACRLNYSESALSWTALTAASAVMLPSRT